MVMPSPSHYTPSQLPSGYIMASAEDLCHFAIALMNQGRYGNSSLLSPSGIAAMQAPGVPTGDGDDLYGLGLIRGSIGGVPAIRHDGGHPNARTFLFFESETRRGAVLLFNTSNFLADGAAITPIKVGVARLLAGQEPVPASLSLPTLYLIVDAVLATLLALAALPLLRLRRWDQRLGQNYLAGRLLLGLRLAWELGLPVLLLSGVRLLLGSIGATSWYLILIIFPDLTIWLWTISLVVLATGILRALLVVRARRGEAEARSIRVSPSTS
jgi:hypothetical protein